MWNALGMLVYLALPYLMYTIHRRRMFRLQSYMRSTARTLHRMSEGCVEVTPRMCEQLSRCLMRDAGFIPFDG